MAGTLKGCAAKLSLPAVGRIDIVWSHTPHVSAAKQAASWRKPQRVFMAANVLACMEGVPKSMSYAYTQAVYTVCLAIWQFFCHAKLLY